MADMSLLEQLKHIWPKDKPLPTYQELERAETQMYKEALKDIENGYQGDWGFSLSLTLLTYNRALWWHLFYPDEKLTLMDGLNDPPIPFPAHG